jgi:hypothetical protein
VNTLLDKGLSNAGVSSAIVDAGGELDPDVVARHRKSHWVKPERAEGPKPTRRDLAVLVRDKTYELVDDMTPEALLVYGRDLAPVIGKGLQAEGLIDKREVNQKKLGLAAGALSLQAWIAGLNVSQQPPELEDGTIIEGVAHEV